MYLHTLRRALIYRLSAYMWQTRKINYRSHKQYFYWLSWSKSAFLQKISFPLSIRSKETCWIFMIFFCLKPKTLKIWNILTSKECLKSVLTLLKYLPPLSHRINFILYVGPRLFFCHFQWVPAYCWESTFSYLSGDYGTEELSQEATCIYSGGEGGEGKPSRRQ